MSRGRTLAKRIARTPYPVLLCGVLAVGVSGCGSSSNAGSTSSTSSATTSSATTGAAAKSDPIVVYAIAANSGPAAVPSVFPSLKAATEQINAAGGAGGHPIKLETCDSAGDPNKELQCVRTATTSNAVAIVGSQLFFNTANSYKLIQAAKIPNVGMVGISLPPDTQNPYAFPLWAADSTSVSGTAVGLAAHGCKAIAGVLDGGFAAFEPTMTAALKLAGQWKNVKILPTIVTATSAPDLSPYVQKAVAEGADCISFVAQAPATIVSMVKSAGENSAHPLVAIAGFEPPKDLIKGTAGLLVNGGVPSSYMTSFPIVKEYVDAQQKADPSAPVDQSGLKVWASMHGLASVVGSMGTGTVSRESLFAALNKATVETGLPGPPINFAGAPVFSEQPRVKTATEVFGVVQGATIVPDTKVGPGGVLDLSDMFKSK